VRSRSSRLRGFGNDLPTDLCMLLLAVLSCCAYSSVELCRLSSLTSRLGFLCAFELLWSTRDEPTLRAQLDGPVYFLRG
jgi:hypothetical protein